MLEIGDLPAIEDEAAWEPWRGQWSFRPGTTYLNHGAFGASPDPVRKAQNRWRDQIESQPMDFFFRRLESELIVARRKLAEFVHAPHEDLIFVENATVAMNIVANSFPLGPGDEVLLTDHEYGAVQRLWTRVCHKANAGRPVMAKMPLPFTSAEETIEALFAAVTEKTRLIVVSHITSPTAVLLPIREICRRARELNIAVCVDGPHALVQTPVDILALGCDFYTASCHKWLSAPFGSGFLYVAPKHQKSIEPPILSWGRLLPDKPQCWADEFTWLGTRDPSAYLSVPAAIDFVGSLGAETIRRRTHYLARYARQRLLELTGLEPLTPDSPEWYGSMGYAPLPAGDGKAFQNSLWKEYGIEVPVVEFAERLWLRISCYLYNQKQDIDLLVKAVGQLLD